MTSTEILLNLKPEDYAWFCKQTGRNTSYVNSVILGEKEDYSLMVEAEGVAIINRYGANSKEYETFMVKVNQQALTNKKRP